MHGKFLNSAVSAGVVAGLAVLSWSLCGSIQRKIQADEAESQFSRPTRPVFAAAAGGHAPIEAAKNYDPAKVELGRDLFHDTRLSRNNTISCASCHNLARGGTDGLKFSVGIDGQTGDINSPTVFNSSLNFRQFWDGRAESLTEQAQAPVHNPKEMGSNWPEIIAKLNRDEKMKSRFAQVFGSKIKSDLIVEAIVEFERTLITVDAPYDRYLAGDQDAMSAEAIEGKVKFEKYGCISCHQGKNIGGNMYQRLGVADDYFKERGGSYASDLGRYNVTKREEDKYFFRVPSLRNVELTPPYFHDGSVHTLDEAVRKMARFQLGRSINGDDVSDLVAFLKSLTGNLPATAEPARGVANAQTK